jgi:hypothetical protein
MKPSRQHRNPGRSTKQAEFLRGLGRDEVPTSTLDDLRAPGPLAESRLGAYRTQVRRKTPIASAAHAPSRMRHAKL